jgi:hypothetical protein
MYFIYSKKNKLNLFNKKKKKKKKLKNGYIKINF